MSEITFKKQARNEAFWKPSWDPKGSQDGSSNRVFSDPNGTKSRLIRGVLWKTGPDAIGSPLDIHFGAQMEPIGLQLEMGTAETAADQRGSIMEPRWIQWRSLAVLFPHA